MSRMFVVVAGAVFLAGACEQGPTAVNEGQTLDASGPAFGFGPDGSVAVEEFEVCKYGTSATFDVTIDDLSNGTGVDNTFSTTLDDGECEVVAALGGEGAEVTVEETSATPDLVQVTVATGSVSSPTITGPTATTNPHTDYIGGSNLSSPPSPTSGLRGVLLEFYNSPPAGGEGCTPGYWRNHAGQPRPGRAPAQQDSWSATGYAPGDGFDATFGVTSSFGSGYTLLDAVDNPGKGEKVFAFHAVAALLNAAHSGVSYDLTEAEVISKVQSAYSSGDFEGVKNELAAFNEQGCPL